MLREIHKWAHLIENHGEKSKRGREVIVRPLRGVFSVENFHVWAVTYEKQEIGAQQDRNLKPDKLCRLLPEQFENYEGWDKHDH